MSENITELKGAVEELVAKQQERFDALQGEGKKNSEGLEKLTAEINKTAEELQKHAAEIEAEKKDREALEAMISRMPAKEKGSDAGDPEYRKSFITYMRRKSAIDEETVSKAADDLFDFYGIEKSSNEAQILKAGLVGSNPDGGYLAPIDPVRFISRRIFETSPVRQVANVISTAREAVSIIVDDEQANSGWVAEVDERPDTDNPQLAEVEIPTHEQYAQPTLSQKSVDDVSINLESWLQEKVAREFGRNENTAFVLGDGVKRPRGFLDYSAWTTNGEYERGKLEYIDTATVGSLDADDLIDIQSAMLEEYQPNSVWMMHRQTWGEVTKLKDNDGQYLINPQLLFSGVEMQLLGRPVRFAGDMPVYAGGTGATDEGKKIITYGDFREGYTIVDRIGIRVLRDPYTKKPFIRYYVTKRVGGAVTNYQAIKILRVQES